MTTKIADVFVWVTIDTIDGIVTVECFYCTEFFGENSQVLHDNIRNAFEIPNNLIKLTDLKGVELLVSIYVPDYDIISFL